MGEKKVVLVSIESDENGKTTLRVCNKKDASFLREVLSADGVFVKSDEDVCKIVKGVKEE